MLRLAILGVGWAGTRQAEAVRELGCKLAVECIVDSDRGFLASKRAELGVDKMYVRVEEALADPNVDAVSICLPHDLHCEVAVAAAAAGKHVLCEKPIALRVDDATRMIEAAESHGVTLYVAESACYTPMVDFLGELVRTGRHVGEVTCASLVTGFRAPQFGYPGRRDWLARPEAGGTGTWMLHGIHSIAQLRAILGEVSSVYMREHHVGSFARRDLEGTMSGLLTLESGVDVSVVQTCETVLPGNLRGYVVHGDRGSIRAWEQGCEIFDAERGGEPERLAYPASELSEYARELEAFADHVAGVAEGPTTGRSERRSLAVVQAGYESARTGQPIDLRRRFGEL